MIKKNYLEDLNNTNKPFIIYYHIWCINLYKDFSQKIILTNQNIEKFINKNNKLKSTNKETDLFIGFFGYEILNNLIGVKIKKQKVLEFPKGIFYKPETKIKFSNKLNKKPLKIIKSNKVFKINLNKASYEKIFNKFKKRIKAGETYQIKICTKYKTAIKLML